MPSTAGADAYGQFVEGASVMLTFPGIVLPILALGLLLSLWREDGLPKAWPVFLGGAGAGRVRRDRGRTRCAGDVHGAGCRDVRHGRA
jgi:hypothetical protein